jgi:hypothetical protein
MPTAQEAYNDLIADPARFLRTYALNVSTSGAGVSAVAQFTIYRRSAATRPGRTLGRLPRVFNRLISHASDRFDIRLVGRENGSPTDTFSFPAHSIAVNQGAANMTTYTLPAGGPPIFVTTMLSGCSFVMQQPQGAGLGVAHIQPVNQNGVQLQASLAAATPGARVYGSANYDSASRRVAVIGIRRNTRWEVYAQKMDNPNFVNTEPTNIMSVYQLWPQRRKVS